MSGYNILYYQSPTSRRRSIKSLLDYTVDTVTVHYYDRCNVYRSIVVVNYCKNIICIHFFFYY